MIDKHGRPIYVAYCGDETVRAVNTFIYENTIKALKLISRNELFDIIIQHPTLTLTNSESGKTHVITLDVKEKP